MADIRHFYKDTTSGVFLIDGNAIPGGKYNMLFYSSDTIVELVDVTNNQVILGPIEIVNLRKENDTAYTNKADLLTDVADLFESGSSGGGTAADTSSVATDNITSTNVQADKEQIDTKLLGYTATASAASTTVLDVNSTRTQRLTGTTTHIFQMPVVSTLTLGRLFEFQNDSTGILTINSSGGNAITTLQSGETKIIECISLSGTDASSWKVVEFGGISSVTTDTTLTGNGSTTNLSASPTINYLPKLSATYDLFDDNTKYQRIPSMCITKTGRIITTCENRSSEADEVANTCIMKFSDTQGKTWSNNSIIVNPSEDWVLGGTIDATIRCQQQVLTPVTLADGSERIYLFFNILNDSRSAGTTNITGYVYDIGYKYSDDDGLTWSSFVSLKSAYPAWFSSTTILRFSPGHGITMKNGTVVIPLYIRLNNTNTVDYSGEPYKYQSLIMYSTDNCETFSISSAYIPRITVEPYVYEYPEGRIVMVSRVIQALGYQHVYYADDLGATWTVHPADTKIPDPAIGNIGTLASGCLIERGKLHSILHAFPNTTTRDNITLLASKDSITYRKIAQNLEYAYLNEDIDNTTIVNNSGKVNGYTSIYYRNGVLVMLLEDRNTATHTHPGTYHGIIQFINLTALLPEILDEFENEFDELGVNDSIIRTKLQGNAHDLSGNNFHGTVNGATSLTANHLGLASGYSFITNDSINHGNAVTDPGTSDFCLWAFVKYNSISATMGILGKSHASGSTGRMWLYHSTGNAGGVNAQLNFTTTTIVLNSIKKINDGNWHFVLLNVDRSANAELYIDGNLDNIISVSAYAADNMTSSYYFDAGAGRDSSDVLTSFLDGSIGAYGYDKRLLTSDEIAYLASKIFTDYSLPLDNSKKYKKDTIKELLEIDKIENKISQGTILQSWTTANRPTYTDSIIIGVNTTDNKLDIYIPGVGWVQATLA